MSLVSFDGFCKFIYLLRGEKLSGASYGDCKLIVGHLDTQLKYLFLVTVGGDEYVLIFTSVS